MAVVGAVLAEVARLSMTASRRLQLAAEGWASSASPYGAGAGRRRPRSSDSRRRLSPLARRRSPLNAIAGATHRASVSGSARKTGRNAGAGGGRAPNVTPKAECREVRWSNSGFAIRPVSG
jgi:hypothetical protein